MEVTFWTAIRQPHSSLQFPCFSYEEKKLTWSWTHEYNRKITNFPGVVSPRGTFFSYYYFSCDCYLGDTWMDGWMDIWLLHIWIHLSLQNFCFSTYSNSLIYKSRKWNYLDWTIKISTTIFRNNYLTWERQYINC